PRAALVQEAQDDPHRGVRQDLHHAFQRDDDEALPSLLHTSSSRREASLPGAMPGSLPRHRSPRRGAALAAVRSFPRGGSAAKANQRTGRGSAPRGPVAADAERPPQLLQEPRRLVETGRQRQEEVDPLGRLADEPVSVASGARPVDVAHRYLPGLHPRARGAGPAARPASGPTSENSPGRSRARGRSARAPAAGSARAPPRAAGGGTRRSAARPGRAAASPASGRRSAPAGSRRPLLPEGLRQAAQR